MAEFLWAEAEGISCKTWVCVRAQC